MAAATLEQGTEWAHRQEWINGRFAEVDRSTGEILSEHRHTPFIRDPYFERPERGFDPPRPTDIRVEWRDGRWVEVYTMTGQIKRRLYTNGQRKEAVRLYTETGMKLAKIGQKLDVPVNTIKSWVHRSRVAVA